MRASSIASNGATGRSWARDRGKQRRGDGMAVAGAAAAGDHVAPPLQADLAWQAAALMRSRTEAISALKA